MFCIQEFAVRGLTKKQYKQIKEYNFTETPFHLMLRLNRISRNTNQQQPGNEQTSPWTCI